jgi:hypothetical protein
MLRSTCLQETQILPETCFVAGGRQAIPLETLGEGLHRNKETTVTDSRTVPSNLAGFPAHRPAVIVILYFLFSRTQH